MLQEIAKRHAIIEALRAGRTAKEIIDFLNYNKDLVYRIKKQFKDCDDPETFTGERKTHKRRSDATKVKQRIQDDFSKSMAVLAFEINVNKSQSPGQLQGPQHEKLLLKEASLVDSLPNGATVDQEDCLAQ